MRHGKRQKRPADPYRASFCDKAKDAAGCEKESKAKKAGEEANADPGHRVSRLAEVNFLGTLLISSIKDVLRPSASPFAR